MIGQVVGQYKILEKVGEGGMGSVYKGIDLMVEREVAIKMLRPEIAKQPELVERFRSEAITLAKLNNPGIATLYNFFRQGDDFFMVMEFVSGQTLDSVIRQSGAMSWQRAVPLFRHILECIQPAHNAGILHRDIKPANIMLTSWGGVKVMDFGIARVLGAARMTREGRMVGTIEYIAPERIKGNEADIRADIYSLGVVLYEMLSGRLPFESTSEYEIMRGHVQDAPPPLARFGNAIPVPLEAVVMRSLAKTPEERYQSCPEFLNDLQVAFEGAGGHDESGPSRRGTSPGTGVAFDHNTLKPTVLGASTPSLGASIQSQGSTNSPFTPLPSTGSTVRPMAASTGAEIRSTRYEPMAPAAVAQPLPQAAPVPSAVAAGSGSKWKLYAAAGALVALIVLGGIIAARQGSTPTNPIPEPVKPMVVVPQQRIQPPPPSVNVDPSPNAVPPPASPSGIDGAPGGSGLKADAPADSSFKMAVADPDDAKVKEKAARLKEQQRKRAAALKALEEQ